MAKFSVLTLSMTPVVKAWHCFTQKLNLYWSRVQLGISSQWQLIQPAVLQMPAYKCMCGSCCITGKRLSWIGKRPFAIHTSLFLHGYSWANSLTTNSSVLQVQSMKFTRKCRTNILVLLHALHRRYSSMYVENANFQENSLTHGLCC